MPARRPVLVVDNLTRSTVVCRKVYLANTLLSGLRGLLGVRKLEGSEGLLLRPSSGIHTWGMQFPIDVISLDRKKRVIGLWRSVAPRRICAVSLKTASVLELPVGQIEASRTEVGDQLSEIQLLSSAGSCR